MWCKSQNSYHKIEGIPNPYVYETDKLGFLPVNYKAIFRSTYVIGSTKIQLQSPSASGLFAIGSQTLTAVLFR